MTEPYKYKPTPAVVVDALAKSAAVVAGNEPDESLLGKFEKIDPRRIKMLANAMSAVAGGPVLYPEVEDLRPEDIEDTTVSIKLEE